MYYIYIIGQEKRGWFYLRRGRGGCINKQHFNLYFLAANLNILFDRRYVTDKYAQSKNKGNEKTKEELCTSMSVYMTLPGIEQRLA